MDDYSAHALHCSAREFSWDLYKWCLKLGPAVPGDLLLDTFELARDIRWTDMAASPYDVSEYGVDAVEIETPHGKAEYVRRQREYARRSNDLRRWLVEVCDAVLSARPGAPAVGDAQR